MFILAEERDEDPSGAFASYRSYLRAQAARFPGSAYALASSDWYFDFRKHECPHDAWLEWIRVEEPASPGQKEERHVSITVRLLGAYHDGHIELYYPKVYEYRFNSINLEHGHRDWRYDEFRVSESGALIHEIEWCGFKDNGSWLIVASDIQYTWMPLEGIAPPRQLNR